MGHTKHAQSIYVNNRISSVHSIFCEGAIQFTESSMIRDINAFNESEIIQILQDEIHQQKLIINISCSPLTLWEIFNELEPETGRITSKNSLIFFSQLNLMPPSGQMKQLCHFIGMSQLKMIQKSDLRHFCLNMLSVVILLKL